MTNQTTKHTPGPWRQGINFPSRIIAGDGDNSRIVAGTCLPVDEDSPNEIELANACLIAAAPDLLAALKRTYSTLGDAAIRGTRAKPTVEELNGIMDDLRAAIAKAEGSSERVSPKAEGR